jgi:putative ABC transport system permease protein
VFFVLWQHATYELESDQFHKDHERIYRIYHHFRFAEGDNWDDYVFSTLPPILLKLVMEKNSDVEDLTRIIYQKNFDAIRWHGPQTDTAGYSEFSNEVRLSYIDAADEKISFKETNCAFADPNFFEFFSYPLAMGSPRVVLNRADAVVLSESTARKYFGEQNPVGKTFLLNDDKSFTVTGVFKDFGHNTHNNADLLFSTLHIANAMESADPFQETAIGYYRLSAGADIPKLKKALTSETKLHWNFIFEHFPGSTSEFHFQPLEDAAFEVFQNDAYSPKSKFKLQVFLVVGIVVLIMAWINYLNLQLSLQARRMKELATRKTAGARIYDFINQFFVESLIINALSVLVAVTIIQLLKSPLEVLFQLSVPDWKEITFETSLIFVGVMVLGVLIAALHPALTMWELTIHSLFNFGKVFAEGQNFTKSTSMLQFCIAIVLIFWLGAVFSQVNFVLNSSWGIDRSGVMVVELPVDNSIVGRNNDVETLKSQLKRTAGIEDVTVSRTVVGDLVRNRLAFWQYDRFDARAVPKSDGGVDERYIPFYKLELIAGRNFMAENPTDRNAVIISREAAKNVGWTPEEAIGKAVSVEKFSWRSISTRAEVIGVIEDHRYSPLYMQSTISSETNRGTILTYGNYLFPNNFSSKMSIRLNGSDDVIETIEAKFQEIFPGELFHWYFLDSHMNAHYQSEKIARNQITLFTSIAIGIACLGLLGMISNKVISKTKEIGIRKVLGAQLYQIGQILLTPTFKQVCVAVVIALPSAYLLTQSYLQKFSERVTLQWWHFALPIAILILLLLVTVASLVWRAARRNPVEALKYE